MILMTDTTDNIDRRTYLAALASFTAGSAGCIVDLNDGEPLSETVPSSELPERLRESENAIEQNLPTFIRSINGNLMHSDRNTEYDSPVLHRDADFGFYSLSDNDYGGRITMETQEDSAWENLLDSEKSQEHLEVVLGMATFIVSAPTFKHLFTYRPGSPGHYTLKEMQYLYENSGDTSGGAYVHFDDKTIGEAYNLMEDVYNADGGSETQSDEEFKLLAEDNLTFYEGEHP